MNEIAKLNDEFRKRILRCGLDNGKAVITEGIQALGSMAQAYIFQRVINYNRFEDGNDPYSEHDFGVIEAVDLPKCIGKSTTTKTKLASMGQRTKQTPIVSS